MPSVITSTLTNDSYINGLLGDCKWGINSFSYSFPSSASFYGPGYGCGETSDNFGVLNTAQQQAVRSSLSMYASVANLSFNEITETSTQHADLRYAVSDLPGTAWAYFPSTSAAGGDAWFNSTDYNNPFKGNYAYLTVVHEIGHALGLEHAHEGNIMPAHRDSMEYTVMSYRSYTGASTTSGYVNETWGYAQSLMMYDIAALQHMYGANFSTNSGNTTYTWSSTTGEMFVNGKGQGAPGGNQIFMTVWDGNGIDTYDFSNYTTALTIDLQPGGWTKTAPDQLAKLHWDGSKIAAGNIANALFYKGDTRSLIENAAGGSGSDKLIGNQAANFLYGGAGNDHLTGGVWNDTLDGGNGEDTAAFSGLYSQYAINKQNDGSFRVADLRAGTSDNIDILWSIEWLQFTDRTYSLSEALSASTAGTVAMLTAEESIVVPPVVPAPPVVNTSPDLHLRGTSGKNVLRGADGADKLYGGYGNDTLTGGDGQDTFIFNSKLGSCVTDRKKNFDRVVDFSVEHDAIWLDNKYFTKLGTRGSETAPAAFHSKKFKVATKAGDKNDYILYNKKTGILSYDADGSGEKKAIEFARLDKGLKLTSKDFFII